MNTNRMTSLPAALGPLYLKKNQATLKQWEIESNIEGQRRALIPAEGWPGKNEGERKTAMEKTLAADPALQKLERQLINTKMDLMTVDADIRILEDERRAAEWEIRAQLVMALANKGIPRDEEPFDGVEQHALDQTGMPPLPSSEQLIEAEDQIPF